MDNNTDVLISIKFQIEQVRQKMDEQLRVVQGRMVQVQEKMNSIKFDRRLADSTKQLRLEPLQKQMAGLRLEAQKIGLEGRKALAPLKEELNKVGAQVQHAQRPFPGWALSILFFGMALQRVFEEIYSRSTKVFQDVAHSVMFTVTNTDVLQGSFAYLGYTIGAALDPLMGYLIPIISAIADWVSEHEELTASIVAIGTVAGTVFAVGGAAVLAVNGFIQLFEKLGVVILDEEGAIEKWDWGAFGAFLTDPIVLAVVAALVVLAGLSWKAFKETPAAFKAVKEVMGELWNTVKDLGQSFLDLVGDILGVKINWESLAWFIVWSIKLAVEQFKVLANALIAIIDLLRVAVGFAQAFGEAIKAAFDALKNGGKFDSAGVEVALMRAQNAWNGVKKATENAFDATAEYNHLLTEGPSGLKQEFEQKWDNQKLAAQEQTNIGAINIYLQAHPGATNADIANAIVKEMHAGILAQR